MLPAERRAKIVNAGLNVFLLHGYRSATMERIAREAGVAKPTLYSYFPDKDAVFSAVVESQVQRMRELVEQAFSGPGSGAGRVANALGAKHKYLFRLMDGSPHAGELLVEGRKGVFPAFERWLQSEIVRLFSEDGVEQPQRMMFLAIACADGIARHARHAEEIGPAIRLVIAKLAA